MSIRPWLNCFAPASQNESGWPAAAASCKTGIKFACASSPAGLDVQARAASLVAKPVRMPKGRAKPFRPANAAIAKGSNDEEDQG
jgi:hypothetical protein